MPTASRSSRRRTFGAVSPSSRLRLHSSLQACRRFGTGLGGVAGWMFTATTTLLILAGSATLAALTFLALSVWPADFRRVAREPAFREYAEKVRNEAEATAPQTSREEIAQTALVTVKATMTEQYGLAGDNNRLVNERRAKWRTRAGLATLASVFAVLVLVGLVVLSNVHEHGHERHAGGSSGASASVVAGRAEAE
jgi:hypothetical protein